MSLQETIEGSLSDALKTSQSLADRDFEADRLASHGADDVKSPQTSAAKALSTLEVLPQEIHENILSSALSMASLYSLASSCTTLWTSFQERKMFIMKLVIANEAGPALVHVLALSRIIKHREQLESIRNINDKSSWYWTEEIREDEYQDVMEILNVLKELEIEFSYNYKSRTQRDRSMLNAQESFRFRRATCLHGIALALSRGPHEIHLFNGDVVMMDAAIHKFTAFIDDLSQREAKEYKLVSNFLVDIQRRASVKAGIILFSSIARRSPRMQSLLETRWDVLFDYRRRTAPPPKPRTSLLLPLPTRQNNFMVRRILDSITNLYQKLLLGQLEEPYASAILDSVEDGCVTECESCHDRITWLFSDANWDDLAEVFRPTDLVADLPGNLGHKEAVLQDLKSFIGPSANSFYPRIMDEIFQWFIENIEPSAESVTFESIYRGRWICGICVREILNRHLFDWMIRRRRDVLKFEIPTCPLGFSCVLRAESDEHASKYDHFCYPQSEQIPGHLSTLDDNKADFGL
ncbi:hypothetical protein SCHPADRAFT_901537 [Schizopora paradoxa]|uniref:Uncharacterized protein n=1 Tax=Schizopora paradoxa TaxID=27342 RepID=A0A0H2S441_9AGAM|nr:hypothetical protein SCHPADRAFT_901537 [Schizopora paradoxa]